MSRKKPSSVPLRASSTVGCPRAALRMPLEDADGLERSLLARNPRVQDLLARSAKSGRTSLVDAEAQLLPTTARPG